ncbi:MAG TPA: hypothetical protein VJZ71_15595 [Phycisphaerae bacterium]|nr:hypothetical protein [Phycisphaerae bacterium]
MPDTITELCDAIDRMESRSSILTKIEPQLRRQIVQALINRQPPTFHDVFDFFKLDGHGVSYTAFYYWARKIKRFAALFEMSRTLDEKEDCAGMLPRILASRVLDNSLDDQVDPAVLRRLMETYRVACSIEMAKKRLDLQKQQLDASRELDKAAGNKDILRLARLIARTKRDMDKDPAAPPPKPNQSPP